jgi:hypothetical protein
VRAISKLNTNLVGSYLFSHRTGRLCTIREVDIDRLVHFIHTGSPEEAACLAVHYLGEKQVRAVLAHRDNTTGKLSYLELKIE